MGEDVVAMATVEPVHADIVVVDWMSHSCCKYAKRDWTSTGHFQFRIQNKHHEEEVTATKKM